MYHRLLFPQKVDLFLSPNFKAMFPARVKVRKKDFLVLAGKQQKCRLRAPLNNHPKNFPIQLA